MNELISSNNNEAPQSNEILQSFEELGIAQLTSDNNKKLIFVLIPFALLFLLKDKNPFILSRPKLSTQSFDRKLISLKPIPAPTTSIDSNSIERLTKLLEGVKKVSSIQDLSKTLSKAKSSSGKFNKEVVNEIVGLLGDNISSESKAQIHNFTNMMSMMDKFKDVKKVLDIQRQMKTDNGGDSSMQIDAMIEAIRPMLPEEQAKNIDQFKKMAQMMKLMSMFDTNKNSEDEDAPTE
ncbi:hypothetical protein HNQ80_000732 [Anaerosolibacter carboniphilus]|uniref:Uncharacterized protein n=1 Tax=Anaerosolibacter carboniphilus TaxID=1417629 RepID=A0A841KWT5_9FIRM|nr:hypothetical protein [Anaerosolibacter carboniphilus]MBB6214649.1 hypothetical protein [Anaerosolibacter carboniphilus]